MGKKYLVPDFKAAFKKPSRPKGVKSKEKSSLEKALKKNDVDAFSKNARELYQKDPKYFVDLLGYKLSKNWDGEKRDFWLNKSPPEAVKQVFQSSKKEGETRDVAQWKSELNLENAVDKRKNGRGTEVDPSLQKSLKELSPEGLVEFLKSQKEKQGVGIGKQLEFYPVLFGSLDCGDLVRCGESFFDSGEGGKPKEWREFDKLEEIKDLKQLTEQSEKLNQLYDRIRDGLDEDNTMLCVAWSGNVMNRLYAMRDKLFKDAKKTGDELFGVSQQLANQLKANKIDTKDKEAQAQVALIEKRLKHFSEETFLFDADPNKKQVNDCGLFANNVLAKMKKDPSSSTGKKTVGKEEVKDFAKEFKSSYEKSGGVVKLKIIYDEEKAMCPHHYRTVLGRVGDKYVTYEANVGKKFMLAPEVMCVGLDELLCENDRDSVHRIGFELDTIPPESVVELKDK